MNNNKTLDRLGTNFSNGAFDGGHIFPSSDPTSIIEPKVDFTVVLPTKLINKIFSEVRKDIAVLAQVNKLYRRVAFSEQLYREIISSHCVNAEDWKKYFGDIGEESPPKG